MDSSPGVPQRIAFASDALPGDLDDGARFNHWRDNWAAMFGAFDLVRAENQPFAARFQAVAFRDIGLARLDATLSRSTRTARQLADGTDHFSLGFNLGEGPLAADQHRRQSLLGPGDGALLSNSEPGGLQCGARLTCVHLILPRRGMLERVPEAEDLIAAPLDSGNEAARLLVRYLDALTGPAALGHDPLLLAHVETNLLDLTALVLGAAGEAAELARLRGLRAARLREILAAIRAGYTEPDFSPHRVARQLGVSPRHLQDLLHETGRTFTERVLELRLAKAREMLAAPRFDRVGIGDIAYRCGFNDVSYFIRCFRRRFGAAPRDYRKRSAAD